MRLSKRLETVASFVTEGSNVADIGTDHGYIPIVLVERGIAARALAMDVRSEPLKRAREHILEHGLEDEIEVRLSDGVKELKPGEADTVVIAGMGGELVIHILEDGRHLWEEVGHWILSPQSELHKVRKYLENHGFSIIKEEMVEEDGKYYTVMDVVRGDMGPLSEAEYLYGPCLIRQRHPVLQEFLKREKRLLKQILDGLSGQEGEGAVLRKAELEKQLTWIQEAEHEYERMDGEIR